MKTKGFFSRLNVRIAFYFFVISSMIVILFSVVAYYSASKIMLENRQKQTNDSIVQASDYISSYLDKIKGLSDLIAMHPNTKDALRQDDGKAIESLAGMVNITAESDPRIQSIAVISKNGFAITSDSNMAIPLSDNMMEESWYKGALKNKQMPTITSIRRGDFTMDKSSRVISISHEIIGEDKNHLGVVLIDISYRFIEDYISTLDLGEKGYTYILDSNNKVLYHPDEEIFADEKRARELIDLSNETNIISSREYVVTKHRIPHSDWLLVGVSSMEDVDALKTKLIDTIVWLGGLIILSSIVISFLVSRRLTRPIVELQNAMKELDESWGHIRVERHTPLEISELAKEYNALLDRIQMLTQDISQKENAKRIFELKALQSQINPHFLYNTLDTILWLAEFGENEKVVEVSKALGEMLRLSLNINQNAVPLEQEIAHVKNYLRIQQQRYEDKINYTIEGNEELLIASVPKLILQPIVENSIYHGIRPKKGKGHIDIKYWREEDDLMITVEDDGLGYNPSREEEDHNLIKTKLGGIGMSNVDQRIRILCGEDYGIEVKNRESGGTIVRYRIMLCPKIMEQDKIQNRKIGLCHQSQE